MITDNRMYSLAMYVIEKHLETRDDGYLARMFSELSQQLDISYDKVKSFDQLAAGHVDYHTKFALYCTEEYVKTHII